MFTTWKYFASCPLDSVIPRSELTSSAYRENGLYCISTLKRHHRDAKPSEQVQLSYQATIEQQLPIVYLDIATERLKPLDAPRPSRCGSATGSARISLAADSRFI